MADKVQTSAGPPFCREHYGVKVLLEAGKEERHEMIRKLSAQQSWIMGIAGGIIVSLVLLIINIVLNATQAANVQSMQTKEWNRAEQNRSAKP